MTTRSAQRAVLHGRWWGTRAKPVTGRVLDELGYGYNEDGDPVLRARHRHQFTGPPADLPEWEPQETHPGPRRTPLTDEQHAGLCACYDQGMPAHRAADLLGVTEDVARRYYRERAAAIAARRAS